MTKIAHLDATGQESIAPGQTFRTMCRIDYTSVEGTDDAHVNPVCGECVAAMQHYYRDVINSLELHHSRLYDIARCAVGEAQEAAREAGRRLGDIRKTYGMTHPESRDEVES